MTDIRERLNVRRRVLIDREIEDHQLLRQEHTNSHEYQRAARNVEELRSIEATLATMQLADAQREVAASQRDVAEAQAEANKQSETLGEERENFRYWARKFLTNVTIANSAGFAAVVLFMSKPDSPIIDYDAVHRAMKLFLAGMFMGGASPLLAMLERFHANWTIEHPKADWGVFRLSRTLSAKNGLAILYAGSAAVMLLAGVWFTTQTATLYYKNRSAAVTSSFTPTRKAEESALPVTRIPANDGASISPGMAPPAPR